MPDPSAVCAACSLLLAGLSRVAEISAPAHSTSKRPSPNAHTRRWLQGVDKVSVRAEVEDELELVCGRLALRSVRDECVELVEEHEDELVRAVLDGDGVGLCSTLVGSCEAGAQAAAVTRHTHAIRSESVRVDGAAADANGHVLWLSGHSFEDAVLGRPGHVLLLLYHSEPAVVAAGLPDPVGPAYVEAWREFHKLSAQLGGSVGELAFATLDLRLNDGPALPTQPLPFQQAACCHRRRPGHTPARRCRPAAPASPSLVVAATTACVLASRRAPPRPQLRSSRCSPYCCAVPPGAVPCRALRGASTHPAPLRPALGARELGGDPQGNLRGAQ